MSNIYFDVGNKYRPYFFIVNPKIKNYEEKKILIMKNGGGQKDKFEEMTSYLQASKIMGKTIYVVCDSECSEEWKSSCEKYGVQMISSNFLDEKVNGSDVEKYVIYNPKNKDHGSKILEKDFE